MTVTAGTVEEPGFAGKLITKFFNFLAGNDNQRGKTFGLPDFQNVTTTTASETGQAIDLTDEGAVFLADHLYKVRFRSLATTDNDVWLQEWEQFIYGNDGTTPVLLGDARLTKAGGSIAGAAVEYGLLRLVATYATTTATVAALSSAGVTIGNSSTGVATITHPIARATNGAACLSVHASTDVTTNTEHRYPAVETGVSATTMELSLMAEGITSATGVVADFADVGRIEALLYILPPPGIALVMNSNNVEVRVSHDATDNVRHLVQVWIEEDPLHGPLA